MAMQEALNLLIAHKQRFDDGGLSLEQFQSSVEEVINTVIGATDPKSSDSQELTVALALLEECRASFWITEEQFLRLRSKLQGPEMTTQESYNPKPQSNNNPSEQAQAEHQERAARRERSFPTGHSGPAALESKDYDDTQGSTNRGKRGLDRELESAASTTRMSFMVEPMAQWLKWRNVNISQKGSTMAKHVEPPTIPKRFVIRSAQWINLAVLTALLLLMGFSAYNIYTVLMKRHATWQWVSLILLPSMFFFFAFAVKVVFGTLFAIFFSSVRALTRNSEFYSAVPTPVMPGKELPPVIVQIPVYKEDLEEVIMPTYYSVKKAMDYYKRRGGKVKMLICDDGLLLIDDKQFANRVHFYRRRDIAFMARPPPNRRGLFKKASNMNYTFKIIEKVRLKMEENDGLSLREALTAVWTDMNSEFVGGGDLTIPDDTVILLLDADTKIPEEAIYITMGEFIESPELPYTQHFTTPFSEQNRNFWEQTISAFTKKIYTAGIAAGTSSGDFAPLVGHNAFLRWSAIKAAAFKDKDDNMELKYWSESHVSEDFDMFMRLAQTRRYGRYVMYTGDGFQEGVSLTYIDEVIKLRKFAYGACEMVFNRFLYWPIRGPFSPTMGRFVLCKYIAWYQKISLLSYLATYFALAAGPLLIVMEACFAVFAPEYFDHYAIRGFDVMLTCTVIFGGVASISEIMVHWRTESLKGGSIFSMIWDNIKFLPNITLLFTSCMFPLCTSSACYFFSLKVVWGSTAKEVSDLTCFQAIRDTWAMFRLQYCVMIMFCGAFTYCVIRYHMTIVQAWGPLSFCGFHFLGPILLNPHIMSLSF